MPKGANENIVLLKGLIQRKLVASRLLQLIFFADVSRCGLPSTPALNMVPSFLFSSCFRRLQPSCELPLGWRGVPEGLGGFWQGQYAKIRKENQLE